MKITNHYNADVNDRRSFLKLLGQFGLLSGGGAMLPLQAQASTERANAPKRLITIHITNGAHPETWHPSVKGVNFTLPEGSAPFEDVRQHCVFLDGVTGEGGHRDFHQCLTNNKQDSIDIYAARKLGEGTPFSSLHFSSARQNGLSLKGGSPLPFEMNPINAYKRLFPVNTDGDSHHLMHQTIFESNLRQLHALKSGLSVGQQQRLIQHEASIESLMNRLSLLDEGAAGCNRGAWNGVKYTSNDLASDKIDRNIVNLRTDLFMELSVKAIKCDLSRVITFSFGDSDADILIPGIDGVDWHNCQHGSGNIQNNPKGRSWFSSKVVNLIKMLESEPDIDGGTLLDNTLLYITSDMGDGSKHDNLRTPIVLAGLGINGGQAIDLQGEKWDSVFDTIIQALGLDLDDPDYPQYGHGKGPILGVLN